MPIRFCPNAPRKHAVFFLCLTALTALPAYADTAPATQQQTIAKDTKAVHKDAVVINSDEVRIRELDRQRNEALRTNRSGDAANLQKQIDQLRNGRKQAEGALKKDEADLSHQEQLSEADCAKNPVCAARKRHEEWAAQLNQARQQLVNDEAAAARVSQDHAEIDRLENALRQNPQ